MRSRPSSKPSNRGMEGERPGKLNEEPHLSGAYIRSLVKQLSSSRPKENLKSPNELPEELSDTLGEAQPPLPPLPPPPQPKKQVRRRLHTSRPYQERLLNMAEARREIVTALKFHRAAMKQANEQQLQPQPTPTPPTHSPLLLPLEDSHQEIMDCMKNPRVYPTTCPLTTNMHFSNSPFSPFTYPPPFSWACPPIAPLPFCDNLNLPLPNQPLGLNLNFQGFSNIDTSLYNNNNNKPSPIQPLLSSPSSSSSSYSYSSPSPTNMLGLEVPSMSNEPLGASETVPDPVGLALHPAMNDEEMAEIRSIGEQHDIEWNDTMNVVTSAWWCKFLKSMEVGQEEKVEGDGFPVFGEIMDIPAWLSDGAGGDGCDKCLLEQHMDDFHTEDYLQDATLPCLDIGENEGLDGKWLA